MKQFMEPEIEIIMFYVEDVMTASEEGFDGPGDVDDGLGWG